MKKTLILVIGLMMFCTIGFTEQSIDLTRDEIIHALDGTYSVDYQVEGIYLDILKNTYGNKITIDNGYLNNWKLRIDDIVKVSNTKYIINCTYLIKGSGFPPPEEFAKLIIELSAVKIVYVIEHKVFYSKIWPDGEWKTDMILYRQ